MARAIASAIYWLLAGAWLTVEFALLWQSNYESGAMPVEKFFGIVGAIGGAAFFALLFMAIHMFFGDHPGNPLGGSADAAVPPHEKH